MKPEDSLADSKKLVNTGTASWGGDGLAVPGSTGGDRSSDSSPIPQGAVPFVQGAGSRSLPEAPVGGGAGTAGGVVDYLDRIANVVTSVGTPVKCPGWFLTGECDNGHRFAKELYCGREWCPVCGQDESAAHMRRFARWVGKAQQLRTMGYLVFTLPEEVRSQYRSKARLNELTKRVTAGDKSRRIEGMLKGMGFERGMARWHWFGETPGKWHPHLNVIVESGRLTHSQLRRIRRAWAGILGVNVAVVHYSYTEAVPKMVHTLKYVTRATFRDYTWNKHMAAELYNFRNMRSWGDWKGEPVWELEGEAELQPIAELEAGRCPVCGEPITWAKALPIGILNHVEKRPLGGGYWELESVRPPSP